MQDNLLQLAPQSLPNRRARRYQGDDLCLPVSAFTEADQDRLRRIYAILQSLLRALAPEQGVPLSSRVAELLAPVDELVSVASHFGTSSYQARPSPEMAKTIHDLRGGGLTPLLGQLQLSQFAPPTEAACNAIYFLTRDHLKIMRNALLGLDDAKRNEDLLPKVHGTDFIVEKWRDALLRAEGREVRMEVICDRPCAISESCVEFGALDRILYNMINNACRHAASGSIRLVIFPVPEKDGQNLRLVLLNAVAASDLEYLRAVRLESLFEERTSTTGSGYGLAIATEFVTHAFGLPSAEAALKGGYLGATLLQDNFAVWFHWPLVLED